MMSEVDWKRVSDLPHVKILSYYTVPLLPEQLMSARLAMQPHCLVVDWLVAIHVSPPFFLCQYLIFRRSLRFHDFLRRTFSIRGKIIVCFTISRVLVITRRLKNELGYLLLYYLLQVCPSRTGKVRTNPSPLSPVHACERFISRCTSSALLFLHLVSSAIIIVRVAG